MEPISPPGIASSDELLEGGLLVGSQTYGRDRVVRVGGVLMAGSVLIKVVGGALAVILARQLSVTDFGIFSFAIAYGGVVSIFADLGVGAVTVKELARCAPGEEGAVLGSSMVIKTGVALVCILGAVGGSFVYAPSLRLAAIVSVLSVVAAIPATMSQALSSRLYVIGPLIVGLVTAFINIAGTVAILAIGGGVVALLVLQTITSICAGIAVAVYSLRRGVAVPRIERATMARLGRLAAPLAVTGMAVVISRRADQLILARLSTVAEVARYGAVLRVVDALNMVPVAVAAVALPTFSHLPVGAHKDKADRMAASGFRLLAMVILPFAAVGTVLGAPMLRGLFGPSYTSANVVLAVLLWAHYFGFAGLLAQQIVIAREVTRPMAVLYTISAVVNVSLNIALIPDHGAMGAAWASLVAYSFPFVVASFVPSVRDIFRASFVSALRPALASVITLASLYALPWRGAAAFAVAPIIIGAALLITRSTTPTELRTLFGAFGRRGKPASNPAEE